MFGTKKNIGEQEAAEQAKEYAGKVKEETVVDLVDKEDKIKTLFSKAESLKKYWNDVCEVFALIKDRIGGTYTDTPWTTIAALAGALLYVFVPIDCIPDFIPFAGFLDDASVFGFVIVSVNSDLSKYRNWKSQHVIDVEETKSSDDGDSKTSSGVQEECENNHVDGSTTLQD